MTTLPSPSAPAALPWMQQAADEYLLAYFNGEESEAFRRHSVELSAIIARHAPAAPAPSAAEVETVALLKEIDDVMEHERECSWRIISELSEDHPYECDCVKSRLAARLRASARQPQADARKAAEAAHKFIEDARGDCARCGEGISHPVHRSEP